MNIVALHREQKVLLRWLLGICGTLVVLGFVFIYSSSGIFAAEKMGRSAYFVERQVVYAAIGIAVFMVCTMLPIIKFRSTTPYLFVASILMMLLTFIPWLSPSVHGSHRWLYLGGMSIQPSEPFKLFFFLYIAYLLEGKRANRTSLMHGYVPLLIILAISFVILLAQPDFGVVVTLFATTMALFFIAQFRDLFLLGTLCAALPLALAAIIWKPYRLWRILIFLDPWKDARGRGYQIIQSLVAIGAGGWLGRGIGQSQQKFFYLPMQHTDFIFSIIAEEIGFIGVLVIIALYAALCIVGIRLAARFSDPFATFTTLGFVLLLSLQALINMMVVSGMLPTKGLGLPFISYGGSALISQCAMLGIIGHFVRTRS